MGAIENPTPHLVHFSKIFHTATGSVWILNGAAQCSRYFFKDYHYADNMIPHLTTNQQQLGLALNQKISKKASLPKSIQLRLPLADI